MARGIQRAVQCGVLRERGMRRCNEEMQQGGDVMCVYCLFECTVAVRYEVGERGFAGCMYWLYDYMLYGCSYSIL